MNMRLLGILTAVILTVGCSKSEDDKKGSQSGNNAKPAAGQTGTPTKPAAPPANDKLAKAKQIFQLRCMMCHGASGKGDGQAAAALTPKPRNYTSKKWQKSVTDQQIADTIKKGGAALGLSASMPPQADLSDEDLAGLVELIRSFAR